MITLQPIGFVQGGRAEPEDDDWGKSLARIVLDDSRFTADALLGLDSFSHAEILFHFHLVAEDEVSTAARHPRGRSDWPRIGIFAQRGENRPNRLGISICRIVAVDGLSLTVEGLDAIDGTPVIDIKPVMSGFLPRGELKEPPWAKDIMRDYW